MIYVTCCNEEMYIVQIVVVFMLYFWSFCNFNFSVERRAVATSKYRGKRRKKGGFFRVFIITESELL